MKRIFFALPLNDTATTYLGGLGSSVPGAKVVPIHQLHFTVRFIGEVEGSLFNDICYRFHSLDLNPITISINGVGHFPPRGTPRVLWAGIEPTGELILLRNKLNLILKQCGIPPEKRKFHPHVTLARLNKSSPGRVARFLADHNSLKIPSFQVNRLTLFSSILTPKGAVHTIEAQYPFSE